MEEDDEEEAKVRPDSLVTTSRPLHVQHECFGKASGVLQPQTYTSPDAKCIRCSECGKKNSMGRKRKSLSLSLHTFYLLPSDEHLSPQDFILHLHSTSRENRTCHWGFEPSNWRSYLHLNESAYYGRNSSSSNNEDDPVAASEVKLALRDLEEFKQRFRRSLKRKQVRRKCMCEPLLLFFFHFCGDVWCRSSGVRERQTMRS